MAPLIPLTRYRSLTHRDLPLELQEGDADLRPIALLLLVASVVRVVITLLHREAFDVEATLALLCSLGLPVFLVKSWARPRRS